MALTIRRAFLKDIDFLVETRMEVLRDVFSIPPEQDMSELEQANREYYIHAVPIREHIACFVYDDGEFVGCGGICFSQEMPSPDNQTGLSGYLMNIYTRPDFRQQGIGEQIVRWLVKHAHKQGVTKISLETSLAGRKLYEKMGFVPMPDEMQLISYKEEE